MALFQVDVQVYATAYVRAATKEEAIERLRSAVGKDEWFDWGDDLEVDPNVSLSPAMTSYGFKDDDVVESDRDDDEDDGQPDEAQEWRDFDADC